MRLPQVSRRATDFSTIPNTRGILAGWTILLLTIARIADVATTLHFDPSLTHEGNPIVFVLGGGLSSLIAANLGVWLLCATGVFAYWRGESLRLVRQPKTTGAYARVWMDRVVRPRRPLRSSLPGGQYWHEGLQALRLAGLGIAWAIIVGSSAAIHAWFATYGESKPTHYQTIYSAMTIGGLNYFVWLMAPIGFLIGTALFFWSEFREQGDR